MAVGDKSKPTKLPRTRSGAAVPWYSLTGAAAAKAVTDHVAHLRKVELAGWRDRSLQSMRLYAGSHTINGTGSGLEGDSRLRYNLAKSVIDTATAVLVAPRTLPYHKTRGADWALRRKAQLRNQVLQNQFQSIGVFPAAQAAILDALITGLGVVKFYEDSDGDASAAACERLLVGSIVWDPTEAVAGQPRSIYEVRLVNRDVACALWPEHADAIVKAPGASASDVSDFQLTRSASANQCLVVEAFHLPSGVGTGDGRHVVAVPGAALVEEEWTRPRFPYAFLRGWAPNQLGFPGVSLAELCEPAQRRIEELSDYVETCQKLGSTPRVFVQKGSLVEPEQLGNTPMQVHLYEGQPPVFFKFDATPDDLVAQFQRIREETLSMLGLSASQIAGEKPSGINSAVGLRTMEDITSKRHVINLRYLEQFYLDCAQALVDVNDDIAHTSPDFAIDRDVRSRWLETTKWEELALKPGEAKMAVFPVSALVGSVAAQLDTVQEWVQAGWTDPQTAKLLVAMPDTEGQTEQDSEDVLYAQHLVSEVLDGKVVALDPMLQLEQFIPVARSAYLRAKRDGAPPDVLNEFRRLLSEARQRLQSAVPPSPASGGVPVDMAVPGAAGQPAPALA